MRILKDSTNKVNSRNDRIKPIEGELNSADQLRLVSDAATLTSPTSNKFTAPVNSEKNNASHQFVVAGQECICWSDIIPQNTKKSLKSR